MSLFEGKNNGFHRQKWSTVSFTLLLTFEGRFWHILASNVAKNGMSGLQVKLRRGQNQALSLKRLISSLISSSYFLLSFP